MNDTRPGAPDTRVDGDLRLIAFYLPQFHPIPENDAGGARASPSGPTSARRRRTSPATTSRTSPASSATTICAIPDVRERQAALAREHGIHGFCYYYYWFNGKRLLERPLDEMRRIGQARFPVLRLLGERELDAALGWPRSRTC